MFNWLGDFVSRHWLAVILAWVVLALGLRAVAPNWDDVAYDGDLAYLPPEMTSVQGQKLLAEAFPHVRSKSQIVLIGERRDGPLVAADYAMLDRLAAQLTPEAAPELPVDRIMTRKEKLVGRKLLSSVTAQGQAALVVVHLRNEFMAMDNIRVLRDVQQRIARLRESDDFPEGFELGISGSAAVGGDMLGAAKDSIGNIETSSVLLVLAILLVVYRAPLLVLAPVAVMIVSTVVAMNLVAWATQWPWLDVKVFSTTKIFVIVVLFGSGTDYCLFLIARYKEEMVRGLDRAAATSASLSQVSMALMGSALTTILGLGTMYFARFGKYQYSGPVIGACLCVTLLASLTLAPALLRALGPAVYWPFRPKAGEPLPDEHSETVTQFWDATARLILARPATLLCVAFGAMAPLAVVGWDVPVTYDFLHELTPDRASVAGTAMLKRHFPAGEMGPLTVVARLAGGAFDTKEGEATIAVLTHDLDAIPGVTAVRSLTEPLGESPYVNPLKFTKAAARKHPQARETYLAQSAEHAGTVTRFDLLLEQDPFSPESKAVVGEVESRLRTIAADAASPWHDAVFHLVGTTAGSRDLEEVTQGDRVRIQLLVTLVVFLLLWYVARRPAIAAYLIFTVLFSYFVTMGATELFFTWAYGDTFVGLDWKTPMFLFVILVAIGEDYNIYLVTRVLEDQRRLGARQGLRAAVVATGGIITSCGVIMAGSFLSLTTGTLRGIVQLGFALSLGILLDTFLIRTILVPAYFALWERWRPSDASRDSAERSDATEAELQHA